MANVLSNSGIQNNQVIQAAHVSQSVNALTGTVSYDVSISGSLNVTGSTTLSGSGITIKGGAVSITSSNFNATLTQGTLDLGYSNNAGIIKAGTVSASFYYVSQSLNYNILTASSILVTNLTASFITASNITTSNITASNIITSTVTASIISASNALTASNLLVAESSSLLGTLYITGSPITLDADYDFIRFQRAITLAGTGPYNFSIFKITSSLNTISGVPDVTGSGILIDPVTIILSDRNRWRSIQWNNSEGYGLYGSGSAPNYLNGPLEINNDLTSSNLLVTTKIDTTNISASNFISASNIDASSIRSTNTNVTNALTASIISASNFISASNIGASIISASTALTASLITTHTSPNINVTNALTASIISCSGNLTSVSVGANTVTATLISATGLDVDNINTPNLTTDEISTTDTQNIPLSITSSGIVNRYNGVSGKTNYVNELTINGPNNSGLWPQNTSRTYNIPDVGADGGEFLLSSGSLTPQQIYSPIKFTYNLNNGHAGMITGSLVFGGGGAGQAMTILNWDENDVGRAIQFSYQTGSYPNFTTYQLTRLASSFANGSFLPGSQKGDFIITNDVQNSHGTAIPGGDIIISPRHGKKVSISASAATLGDTGFEVNANITYLKTTVTNVISSSLANSIELNYDAGITSSIKQGVVADARGSGRTQIFDSGFASMDNISISTGNVDENIRITGSLRLDDSVNTKLGIPTSNNSSNFIGKMYWDNSNKRLYIHDGTRFYSSSFA